jgi:hypothetical protein
MKKIKITSLLIFFASSLYCQSEVFLEYNLKDYFLKSDIISDLNYIFKSIEDVHPNPYHDNSKEHILYLKDSIVSLLPDTISKNQTYLAFKQMTAAYKEGHTDVELFVTKKDLSKYQNSFPLWIDSYNDSGFVVTFSAFDTVDIRAGDMIISINNLSHTEINNQIAKYSGESKSFAINNALGLLFPLWIELLEVYAPFNIKYVRNGTLKTTTIEGISAINYNKIYEKYIHYNPEPFTFSILENNIGYIEFNSFSYPKEFKRFLKKTFAQIKKNGCNGLIIDLRNNGGGMADLDDMMLDYINENPYIKIFAKDSKISQYHKDFQILVAQKYKDKGFSLEGRKRYLEAPNNTLFSERDTTEIIPGKNKLRYSGPVCFLIGPKCFSNAKSFIELLENQKICTLIGEPLEAIPDEYADLCFFVLPKTKFKFSTSTAHFLPLTENYNTPAKPDILIKQKDIDSKQNLDSALEFSKKWILEQ